MVGKSFLREALSSTQFAQTDPQRQKYVLHLWQSGCTIRKRLQTTRRQTSRKYLQSPNLFGRNENNLNSFAADAKVFTLPTSKSPCSKANEWGGNRSGSDVLQESDETLLSKVQEGDRNALASLFRRYGRAVHSLGRRILRDKTEAEDLVQEVFLYLHRKSDVFVRSKGTARSWILQVAYTQALMRRRELKSHGFYYPTAADSAADSAASVGYRAHHEYTVEGLFGRNEWKKVWDSLTECQREALRLHFYEGCTFSEIGERLSQSYANIRHHYYRGLEKLRKHAETNGLRWP
jgi:RNA polymerase sigma-70 factor, ECF subfamily